MGTRTVRLDDDTEKILEDLVQETGQSISTVLKSGLLAFRDQRGRQHRRSPFEIYEALDLGAGDDATAPSTAIRRGVQEAIRRKLAK